MPRPLKYKANLQGRSVTFREDQMDWLNQFSNVSEKVREGVDLLIISEERPISVIDKAASLGALRKRRERILEGETYRMIGCLDGAEDVMAKMEKSGGSVLFGIDEGRVYAFIYGGGDRGNYYLPLNVSDYKAFLIKHSIKDLESGYNNINGSDFKPFLELVNRSFLYYSNERPHCLAEIEDIEDKMDRLMGAAKH